MSIARALLYLFPEIDLLKDCRIEESGTITAWNRPEPQPTPAQIAAAMLPATKAARIEADRAECERRLIAHYGEGPEQVSRAMGWGYGLAAQASIAAGVQATVDASNVARDTINLPATDTVAKVEAVPVAWPVLT